MSLKKQAIGGVKWTTTSSVVNTLIQLIQLAILTRLLSPSDFGLMALVMVVIGFSQIFIDMGVSNAIIYKQEVTSKQLSSLYWLNIIIGFLFFFLIVFSAPIISNFYNNEKLTPLIKLVAITFLIKPFGQQFMVLLQKNLRFNAIAKTDMITKFISFVVVVTMAYKNFGVYSLAFGTIIFSFFSTMGYILYGRKLHRPKFYLKISGLNEYISFGLFQMGERIIQYFAGQFDTILIGKLLGIEVLGIYNVAKSLVSKPAAVINPVITKVTFPLMSVVNNDISKLKSIFLKVINYLSFVNIPVYFLLAVLAKPIVLLMFGSKWIEAVPIIQILSVVFILRSIGNPAGSLLLSRGKANIAFYWNLLTFILFPIFIIIGTHWGIIGVTFGILCIYIVIFLPNWKYIVNKMTGISLKEYLLSLLNPLLFSGISIFIASIPLYFIHNNVLQVLVSILIFFISYSFFIIKYEPNFFIDIISLSLGNFSKKLNGHKDL